MPIFVFILIFALWSLYKIRKSSEQDQKRTEAFWANERAADNVRKQDISGLNYITIPYDLLPFDNAAAEPIKTYQANLTALKGQKIVNLTGYSNTDLKLKYGAANLPDLINCDSNYTTLVSNLSRWGQACFDNDNITDAKSIYEYCIRIHADVSSCYINLGQIYLKQGDTNRIYDLLEQAQDLNSLMKESIVTRLHQLLEQDSEEVTP